MLQFVNSSLKLSNWNKRVIMTSFPVKASYDTNQKETMSPKGDGVFGKIHSNLKAKQQKIHSPYIEQFK